jgi:hypothetical protein
MYKLSEELLYRIGKNKNALVCIAGATGSGKSYAGLSEAEDCDPEFTADRVVFGLDEFMTLVKNDSKKLHKGSAIMLDELGVLAPSREWYSLSNRVFNYVLQTFRSDNLIVFFCVPDLSFVDSQTRKLFHYLVQPRSINHTTNISTCKVFRIDPNIRSGEIYYKYPVYFEKEDIDTITTIDFHIPSAKLRHAYEEKKENFKCKLYANIIADLKGIKDKTERSRHGNREQIISTIVETPKYFERSYGGRTFIDASLIRSTFMIGKDTAASIKAQAEKILYDKGTLNQFGNKSIIPQAKDDAK